MSVAKPELENRTDKAISDWIARAKKLVDHGSLRDYGEPKVVDAESVDQLLGELVAEFQGRNAAYDKQKTLAWWNKISAAKVRGVTYNLTDMIEVLWMMRDRCSPRMLLWLNFFMAKTSRAVIKCERQATTLPGQVKVRRNEPRPPPQQQAEAAT